MNPIATRASFAITLQTVGLGLLPLVFGPRIAGIPLSWQIALLALGLGALLDGGGGRASSPSKLFFFGIVISALLAHLMGLSIVGPNENTNNWLTLTLFALTICFAVFLRCSKPKLVLTRGLVISAILIAAIRIPQLTTLSLDSAQQPVLTEYYLQSAYILALGSIALLDYLVTPGEGGALTRLFLWLLQAAILIALLSFASRTALIMSIIGMFTLALRRILIANSKLTALFFAPPIFLLGVLFFYASPATSIFRERITDSSMLEQNAARRSLIQGLSWELAAKYPLGIGWDSFTAFSTQAFGEAIRSTHSIYSGLILSVGVPGMALLVGLAATLALSATRLRTDGTGITAALGIAVLVAGFADDFTVYPIGLTFLTFLLALGWKIVRSSHDRRTD